MKKIAAVGIVIISCVLVWYLFFKKGDYIYQFKEKASTGTLYYSISNWEKTSDDVETQTLDSVLYKQLTQKLTYKDEEYVLFWDLENLNDSISKVSVGVKKPGESLYNRLTAPFSKTAFKQEAIAFLTEFKTVLFKNLSTFKVNIEGRSVSPEKSCACVNAVASPDRKAAQMMRNYNYISNFIVRHDLQADGYPMVIINNFDKEVDRIDMDFCFPIKGVTSLPESKDIYFRGISAEPSLKGIFNGNYMYSHHSWFSLFDYAENHDIQLKTKIVEQFHNNPNLGGDALKWKTEVYIPLVE
ncbi:hypothetical protein OOZ15_08095 [Galbibacter sp. EGI 63066]|uniref:hypothetical protein n=1 Tax=Galbibacter sp. EGI 63066 TaxID=2993559 RepID=UPI0022496686|nr:hypothetical protein [Galbibacter sp. EGI 63066]MCX2679893.1 hypothetical protein [Galbibacter sp. EGI 63066]